MDTIWLEGEPTFCSMVLFVWLYVKEDGGERRIYTTFRCHMLCVQGS